MSEQALIPTSDVRTAGLGLPLRRGRGKRQPLSCLACRRHKLRCDRAVPCGSCVRYSREDYCRQNPASARRRWLPARASATVTSGAPCTTPQSGARADHAPGNLEGDGISMGEKDVAPPVVGEQTKQMSQCPVQDGLRHLAVFDMEQGTWASLPHLLAESTWSAHPPFWGVMVDIQLRERSFRQRLSSVMPSRPQCDLLVNFYLEHVNWIFQTIHEPSFRREYGQFWETGFSSVGFIWVSLLFTVVSISALYVPLEAAEVVGFPRESIRNLSHIWHLASMHALRAGNYEAKPCLVQLQTFSNAQLYWYATNQIEVMNSYVSGLQSD